VLFASIIGVALAGAGSRASGANPHPVTLIRAARAPLSTMAQLGRRIFFDRQLSSSRERSCADCHSPQHAFGPPGAGAVMDGGPALTRPGLRAVPSLMYLERKPNFSLGPENPEDEATRAATATGPALVPQGGLFWDGRADTLQDQAQEPLLDPNEMDGGSIAIVAAKLRVAAYAPLFTELFGPSILQHGQLLVAEALFAAGRYQIEDPAFHPYSSKYDAWLEGKARFTPAEQRGYALFNDKQRADCAACHLDRPAPDGLPPLFTDDQYEALGVPRNQTLAANRDPRFADLGICGPVRTNMRAQTQYCGMFATPTLRNVALRRVFFHNGVYHTLQQVLDFYDERDTAPQKIYPRDARGMPRKFNDLPARFRDNIDTIDAPFDRRAGQTPILDAAEERDIIAFLKTLTDGYER
jgi:cytochrome c peroxidase